MAASVVCSPRTVFLRYLRGAPCRSATSPSLPRCVLSLFAHARREGIEPLLCTCLAAEVTEGSAAAPASAQPLKNCAGLDDVIAESRANLGGAERDTLFASDWWRYPVRRRLSSADPSNCSAATAQRRPASAHCYTPKPLSRRGVDRAVHRNRSRALPTGTCAPESTSSALMSGKKRFLKDPCYSAAGALTPTQPTATLMP